MNEWLHSYSYLFHLWIFTINYWSFIIYLFERAFPLVQIFLKPTLSFSNWIGRLINTLNPIKAKESVVNRAMPHSDEAKAKIDRCMELIIYKKYYQSVHYKFNYLLKIIVLVKYKINLKIWIDLIAYKSYALSAFYIDS